MKRSGAWRILGVLLSVLMLMPGMPGCAKKNKATETTQAAAGNPLIPQPGGAPAQGVIRRGGERQKNQQVLRDIGQYYALYRTEQNRAPRNLDEFLNYVKNDANARSSGMPQALESGAIVMVFSPESSSNPVLAYEKQAFQQFQNRLVLFGDGSVKLMDEAMFQAALKAR